jgi:hypothetical protein
VYKLWNSSSCSPPAFRSFLPLMQKYSPQHPVLRHPRYMFFPEWGQVSHEYKCAKLYFCIF